MGLLDNDFYNDPGRMGMMRAGLGLLSGGGVNNAAIARMMGGVMDGEMDDRRRKADEERRRQEAMLMQLKMRAAQGDYEAAEQARQIQAAINADPGMQNGAGGDQPGPQPQPAAQNMPQLGSTPQQSRPGMPQIGAPAMPPGMPAGGVRAPSGYSRQPEIARLTNEANIRAKHGDHAGANALRDRISKITPQVKSLQEMEVNGKILYVPVYEDGTPGEPVPYEVARKLEIRNTGGYTDAFDPYTGVAKTRTKNTQSPESIVSERSAAAGRAQSASQFSQRLAHDRGASRDLLNQEKQLKIEALQGKADDRQLGKQNALASVNTQIGAIDRALAHPGRSTSTGLSGVIDPRNYVPGTDATNFRAVAKQIGGGAFLQAFESLKGGGAITEMEGAKATDAIARLDRAQSDGEYEVALTDLRDVLTAGAERMKLAGKVAPSVGGSPPRKYNPATGRIE